MRATTIVFALMASVALAGPASRPVKARQMEGVCPEIFPYSPLIWADVFPIRSATVAVATLMVSPGKLQTIPNWIYTILTMPIQEVQHWQSMCFFLNSLPRQYMARELISNAVHCSERCWRRHSLRWPWLREHQLPWQLDAVQCQLHSKMFPSTRKLHDSDLCGLCWRTLRCDGLWRLFMIMCSLRFCTEFLEPIWSSATFISLPRMFTTGVNGYQVATFIRPFIIRWGRFLVMIVIWWALGTERAEI